MSEMVEWVKKAIMDAENPDAKDQYADMARAAIEAMRELVELKPALGPAIKGTVLPATIVTTDTAWAEALTDAQVSHKKVKVDDDEMWVVGMERTDEDYYKFTLKPV